MFWCFFVEGFEGSEAGSCKVVMQQVQICDPSKLNTHKADFTSCFDTHESMLVSPC